MKLSKLSIFFIVGAVVDAIGAVGNLILQQDVIIPLYRLGYFTIVWKDYVLVTTLGAGCCFFLAWWANE